MTARAGPVALGPRHHEVKRLRALLRDPKARAGERAFVLEGPRIVADALRRGAPVSAIYLGTNARVAFRSLLEQAEAAGVPVAELKEGVLEKVGSTRTPQPVLAIASMPAPVAIDDLRDDGPVLVAVGVADPGNLGTLLRSAEASGCSGVVCCGDSVDVHNPRVVRASAGAVFGIPIVEPDAGSDDPVQLLDALGARGMRRYAATGRGVPASEVDLTGPIAFVLGNEARGLSAAVLDHVDGLVAIPMAGVVESLNVAMAGTVLAFEAARRRAAR